MEEICKKENCTGCFACVNACPKGCISMVQNNIGHIYPQVNNDLCINCGLCQKTCPANNEVELRTPQKTYASWSLDEKEHRESTSGGLGTLFARNVVKNGGVVYGCSSVIDNEVHHIRVDKPEDIYLLQGSKYVHSYINDCYKKVKADLTDGKQVLFIGTPCQVAGLVNYLGKEYDNLITVDLICHGVPPQKLLFNHLNKAVGETNGAKIEFRNPDGYNLRVFKNDNCIYSKNEWLDPYYLVFDAKLAYRQSCYNCRYATQNRCADITIGDFWGLGAKTSFDENTENGVSVMFVNTENGKKFYETIKDGLFTCERELSEAVNGNGNLNHPTNMNSNETEFEKSYKDGQNVLSYIRKEQRKYRLLYILNQNKLGRKILETIK